MLTARERADAVACLSDRAVTFDFLSKAMFKELTVEAIDALASMEPVESGNVALDEGYAKIARYFAFSEADRRAQLACEYARVFLGAGVYVKECTIAAPYESVYTSEERIMMQESRDEVVRWFAADGFQVDRNLHEPEDHLAFELEYVAAMCRRAAKAAAEEDNGRLCENLRRQIAFIQAHPLAWIDSLYAVACEFASLAFYTGLLLVVKGMLQQSVEFMAAILESLGDEAQRVAVPRSA